MPKDKSPHNQGYKPNHEFCTPDEFDAEDFYWFDNGEPCEFPHWHTKEEGTLR